MDPLTFDEVLLIETYRDAYKTSISDLNETCDKSTTAAFSLATAYGALLALVSPQDQVHGLLVGIPFALFAVAAVLALTGRSLGVKGTPTSHYAEAKQRTVDVVDGKRRWAHWSIGILAIAVLAAGTVVVARYGDTQEVSAAVMHIGLTEEGRRIVAEMCGDPVPEILTAESVSAESELAVLGKVAECGGDSIWLPASAVRARQLTDGTEVAVPPQEGSATSREDDVAP